jgi:glycosyltransferase involved in cell wall biosynthesis
MRVLQVNTYHYPRGGDAVHALALADALTAAGHEVRWFGMQHPENQPSPDSEYWMPYIDFAELSGSRSPRDAFRVLGRTLYSPEAARRIGRMIDAWRPDVAHLHSIHGHVSLSVLVELGRRGIPVVWTLHDYKLLCPDTHLMLRGEECERCKGGRFMQCTLNRCKKGSLPASAVATLEAEVDRFVDPQRRVDRFIAPSCYLMDTFREFGWDTSRFTHLPNFAPVDPIPVRREPRAGRFAYAGRLDRAKGVATLVRAVGAVPGAILAIAGDGPLETDLRALADSAAPGRVTFLGRVGPSDLARLRDGAMAVVIPSECRENSPLTLTEAFARGCPVIAADVGGLPESVTDGENGLLFRSGGVDALACALRRVISDPALEAHMSEGASRSAAGLGIDSYVSRLLDLYCSVIDERVTGERSH